MNLEIEIDELSLPHGSNVADLHDQIAVAIHGHLDQDASSLFNTSKVLESIGECVANTIVHRGVESSSSQRS